MKKCNHPQRYWGAGYSTPDGYDCVYCHKCNRIIKRIKGIDKGNWKEEEN